MYECQNYLRITGPRDELERFKEYVGLNEEPSRFRFGDIVRILDFETPTIDYWGTDEDCQYVVKCLFRSDEDGIKPEEGWDELEIYFITSYTPCIPVIRDLSEQHWHWILEYKFETDQGDYKGKLNLHYLAGVDEYEEQFADA